MKHLYPLFLKSFLSLAFLLALTLSPVRATSLTASGAISVNTTWSVDTVFVTGDITVNNGITLTIDPGVLVLFTDSFGLHIQGRLLAQGTVADSIRFTMEDTTGYSTNTHTGWGGIRFDGTPATNDTSFLDHCVIEFAQTDHSSWGGGLRVASFNKVTLTNSSVRYCSAIAGGGILVDNSSMIIRSVSVSSNLAYFGQGGGMAVFNYDGIVTDSKFLHNKSTNNNGGGIDISFGSDLTFKRNIVRGNHANTGGGIMIYLSSPHISENLILENTAFSGAGINVVDSSPVVANNTIVNNTANNGGGVSYFSASAGSFINNIVWHNTANISGASFYIRDDAADPDIHNCNFEGGLAGFSGAGAGANFTGAYIDCINIEPAFTNSAVMDFSLLPTSASINAGLIFGALSATDLDGNPRVHSCVPDMGAYENQTVAGGPITADTTWASDTVFVHCDVDIADGATLTIDPGVVVMFMDSFRIKVEGRLLAQGTAADSIHFIPRSGLWGGLRFDTIDVSNDSSIVDYAVIRNAGKQFGGGIWFNWTNIVRISNSTIIDCQASINGGAIAIDNGSPVIRKNNIQRNTASGLGGGIFTYTFCQSNIQDNVFSENQAADGGGLFIGFGGTPMITGNHLSKNTANNGGGIVIGYNSAPLFSNNLLDSNIALTNGGGLQVINCGGDTVRVSNNTFRNNEASNGGAIALNDCNGSLIEDNEISQNQSGAHGGGVYLASSAPVMEGNAISANSSVNNGAGIYMVSSSPELRSNVISANQSGENGGGLYLTNASNPTLIGNIIHSNYCQGLGGAINMVFGCSPVIQNDLYYGNVANWKGGAVYADFGSAPVLTNVTIANNNASDVGGGLVCSSGSVAVIINSILFGNTAGNSGDNVYLNDDDSDPEFHYSIIEGGPAAFAGLGSGANYSGIFLNNLDMDPLLADTSNGNYRLLPVSPAINAGSPDTTGLGLPLTDLDGNARVYSCAIDMGAYESQSNLIVGGAITSDTTWSSDTVFVHCDVDIADGATLTIDPGVVVLFMGPFHIDVKGRLLAKGSPGDSIRFTRESNYWSGIQLNSINPANDSTILDYVVIKYSGNQNSGAGFSISQTAKVSLSNSLRQHCAASSTGGAVSISSSQIKMHSNTFRSNSASYGAAIFVVDATVRITNSFFLTNAAVTTGGGFYVGGTSQVTLINAIAYGNQAGGWAGFAGLYDNSHMTISNSTITGNSAGYYGGGLRISSTPNSFTLKNVILRDNVAGIDGQQHSTPSGYFTPTYSNIQGGFAGTGNVDVDPLFTDASNGDFRLQACSPMINAGDPDTSGMGLPMPDFDDQTRLMHDTVDIGAAEYNGPWPLPQSDIWAAKDVFCQDDAGEKIFVAPAGGQLTGPGVAGGHFYPAFAGPGPHWLHYSVSDSMACPTQDSLLMTVHPLPSVVHPALPVCEDVPNLVLAGGSPATGTYSGAYVSAGLFDVQAAGVGSHNVEYTYTELLTNCTRTISFVVMVTPLPVVDFPDPAPACNQSGLLTLSASPAGGTYSGNFVSGNTFNTDASGEGSFTAYYSYADSNGCVNTDSATIMVLPLPTLSLTADTSVCPGECVQLQASGGISYRWNTGYKFASFNACPQQTTTYTVTVTDANGCSASEDVTITLSPLPVVNIMGDDTICPGETSTLFALFGKPHIGNWSNGSTGISTTVSPSVTTTYTLTVTNLNTGCTASDEFTLVVRPAPVASASYGDTVCPGECTDLTASGGVAYAWSSGGTAAVETVCPDGPASYTVTVSDAFGCTAEASVNVPLHPAVAADAGADQTICLGESAVLQAGGGMSYVWMPPVSQAGAQIMVSPSQDQKYYVEVFSAEGCSAIDSVMVYVNDSVSLSIIGADTIQPGDTTLLTAHVSGGPPPFSYTWSPMDFVLNDNGSSIETAPVVNTAYTLSVVDANGCQNERNHLVVVDHPGAVAAGRITYANIWDSPINQATVFLKDMSKSSPIVDSTLTDDRGFFYFNGLDTASYLIEPALNGRWGWGGVNATDGLLVALHFVNLVNLQGVFLGAADVDTSNYVNATDALAISQRFAGLIPGFIAGDWHFPETLIAANGQSGPTPWIESRP